jgi:hypothetical protein
MRERSAPTAGQIKTRRRALAVSLLAAAVSWLVSSCTSYYEVPIEVPISAKLDVSQYNRILVAGFTTQTNENLDLDAETVRLLKNQLRMRSNLQIVDAELEPLGDFSERTLEQTGMLKEFEEMEKQARAEGEEEISRQEWIDLEQDKLLDDEEYWKDVGEEYQNPLIVTGKLRFGSESRSGYSRRDRYVRDAFNRPTLQRSNIFEERTGYTLNAEFYFINGETGRTIHRERFTEEVIYGREEQASALSSYFELMDRLIPNFLSILSPQTFRGTRVLLK